MEVPPLSVLGYVNDYKIRKNQLRIQSFYQFHQCQYNQYKDISKPIDQFQLKKCESNLKGYFELKKKMKKPEHLSNVYYEFPENNESNPLLDILINDLAMT